MQKNGSIQTASVPPTQRAAIVSQATVRAASRLGLTNARLAEVLGVSEATVSRMKRGGYVLEHGSKHYELALLLLRLFRGIDAILGGDERAIRSWMTGQNTVLYGRPIDLIIKVNGLVDTVGYVDSRRAPI
ncbi:antitoxin Xre-like helix-turn-helix domain-containing protein [Oleispirillum naphthae]|uniref:antitoxin Xre-like helix-turn-helix domain-containing protein n=1 Tax=Oleispirillum naphthae TaxID=2838853 RepID=UPI0030825616